MSDSRLRALQRKAQESPNDSEAVWAYARELERTCQVTSSQPDDKLILFKRVDYVYFDTMNDYHQNIWYETPTGMTFHPLPFTQHFKSSQEILEFWTKRSPSDHDDDFEALRYCLPINYNYICGYAVIDAKILDLLRINYAPGNNSADDAVADFKTAFCVANAHTVRQWRCLERIPGNPGNSSWRTLREEENK